MNATVVLRNVDDGLTDIVEVENINSRKCFSYFDNESNPCEICIYEDGLCFFRQCSDHMLELNLRGNNFARITTEEGIIRFPVKVVDFQTNNDILVMHYIVNDEARIIEIKYLGEYGLNDKC